MSVEIDPEILAARVAQAGAFAPFDVTRLPPAEARCLANTAASMFNDGQPEMARVEEWAIPSPGGDLRARLYEPRLLCGSGAILYLHGGGWFACNVETHDRMLRTLAKAAGVTVIGIDYRLSPEHPYPAALDDCRAAWHWLQANAALHGIAADRIALAGDSAGANLALALSIDLRDTMQAKPAGAALLYGCFAPGLDTASARTFGAGGYGLTAERMAWYWDQYLGAAQDDPPVLATPLHADLAGLPPIFIGIAEADSGADESRLLLQRLQEAGVDASSTVWTGTVHGFLQMTRDVASARAAVAETAAVLKRWTA